MQLVKKIINFAISFVFVWCAVSAVAPYWNKYWLGQNMETVAIYGTKNSLNDTRKFLVETIKSNRHDFSDDDFMIEKDENDNVRITITYTDKITVFGANIKEVEFTVEKTVSEVDSI